MFGLFKSSPPEPVAIEADVVIDAPADRVLGLIDPATPEYGLRQRGFDVEAATGEDETYVASGPDLLGFSFRMTVLQRDPGRAIKLLSAVDSDVKLGALEDSMSVYRLEAVSPDQCRVTLVETPRFEARLGRKQRAQEQAIMTLSVHNDLSRLKILAEEGAEAAAAFDEPMIEFDFGTED